ncbi:MAG TPA: nucleoside deaminase [Saprospiraceae bacterium]|nr:nucleoside deaminase [Saprospiraceae bacterium]
MNHEFMLEAIRLAKEGMDQGNGGPFGCVIVKNGVIIGRGNNQVTSTNDPTAHAEIVAIRDACQHLNSFQLEACEIYASCEPCPMCLGAIYWARPTKVYYGCSKEDAALIDFDDSFIYTEISKSLDDRHIGMEQLLREEALKVFIDWAGKTDKMKY